VNGDVCHGRNWVRPLANASRQVRTMAHHRAAVPRSVPPNAAPDRADGYALRSGSWLDSDAGTMTQRAGSGA
jgi:hypothetical protein